MQIKWKNIAVLLVTIFLIVLLVISSDLFHNIAVSLLLIGPGHSPKQQLIAASILGAIVLLVVVLVRILVNHQHGDRN